MMTPAPISVERLRELLEKATPSTGWVVTYDGFSVVTDDEPMHRIHVASCVEPDDAALIAEAITALPALLQQFAEMSADLEREQGVREDAQRQLRAAERAREGATGLLRKAWRILDIDAPNDKTTDDIAAFLAASGGKVDG